MRDWINLFENWHDKDDDGEYIIGSSMKVERDNCPPKFYHGTNIISAVAIFRDGYVEATEQDDDDEYVVCLTSEHGLGVDFAVEYVRLNSELETGAVFTFDGPRVAGELGVYPFHAETAGVFEHEFRVEGDLSLDYCTGIEIVGRGFGLDNYDYMEDLYESAYEGSHHRPFASFDQFFTKLQEMLKKVH